MSDVEFNVFIESLPNRAGTDTEGNGSATNKTVHQGARGKKRPLSMESLLTTEDDTEPPRKSPFMDALERNEARNADAASLAADNKMLTENADVAHISTKSALVDAFYELEDVVDGERLQHLLDASWQEDPLATLKILFNARSIHLGKSSRPLAYKAFGWLYQEHPKTLLHNLMWLIRPVIEKKVEKEEKAKDRTAKSDSAEDDDMVLVEDDKADSQTSTIVNNTEGADAYDIRNGVSHGYWKDLLNILALAANGELRASGDPDVLSTAKWKVANSLREWDHEAAKRRKKDKLAEQHDRVVRGLENDLKYRALHLTIARLFAAQLKQDSKLLASGKKKAALVTLAGKWAPSPKEAHDRHTFVVSSIAELLHDHDSICPGIAKSDRETYLKHAREAYRCLTISPLRKHLQVVERDITAKTYERIDYQRLPSLALRLHQDTIMDKDFERFNQYLEKVSEGKARISGATLLPSTLVHEARQTTRDLNPTKSIKDARAAANIKLSEGQWKSLVQRVRDSGSIKSSIAVCDVSGSMSGPEFKDGTCPMDSAIGLSLLLAEVCDPPFGGGFITFSANPTFQKVGGPNDTRSFQEKVDYIAGSEWGMNTDFVAVFERLILPMATQNKIAPEDMVKQIFVFSDMQFDAAENGYGSYYRGHKAPDRWSTSFERISKKFEQAGYEMPQLVFWNLAGGRAGYTGRGNTTAPKPVTMEDVGTALVSGYSQGQMKMFLDGGKFEDPEEQEVIEDTEVEGTDGITLTDVKVTKKKPKMDPLSVVKKAISHPAYGMLKVID